MRPFLYILYLLLESTYLHAQGYILISDSLAAHAEILQLNIDNLSGKTPKLSIGDYTVLSDRGTDKTYYYAKNTALGAKSKSEITRIISFVVVSSAADTAIVTTEDKSVVQTYYPNVIFPNFPLDFMADQKSNRFTAWIMVMGDSAATWILFMESAKPEDGGLPVKMILTDGVTIIKPVLVTSDPDFDYDHPFRSLLKMPAMGFEFFEEGHSLGALQYYAGASYRQNKDNAHSQGCMAWMDRDLDAKTKLVLAAAMSTLVLRKNSDSGMDD